jgi:hypothetical protein
MKTNLSRLLQLIIFAAIIFLSVMNLHAQVTVGSNIAPSPATLLELKSQQTAASVTAVTDAGNVTSATGGLLLPRVQLVDSKTLEPFIETSDDIWTNGDAPSLKLKLAGLLVYNITDNGSLKPGIYIWTGIEWTTFDTTVLPSSITGQPDPFTFYEKGTETPAALEFHADGPGIWTYQWYRMISTNVNFHGGEIIDASNASKDGFGSGYDSPLFTPKVCLGTTRNANNCGFYRYYCIATSTSGITFRSDISEVAVGCGAKNNQGEWITFMCYNLGAQHGITIDEQKKFSIDHSYHATTGVHTYITGEETVYGDLFQWGRIPDGHEKRTSLTLSYGYNNSMKTDSIVSGGYCSASDTQRRPAYQIKKTSPWYGKFITGTANWNPYQDTPATADQLWRAGRFIANDPCAHYKDDGFYVEFWHEDADETQPSSGVCSGANTAWKLPSPEEFGAIYKGGTISGNPNAATANTWFWNNGEITWGYPSGYNSLKKPAGYEIRPNNETTTLFLPASGYRHGGNASLRTQGSGTSYWSSRAMDGNAYTLNFSNNNIDPATLSSERINGYAIRCVKNI